MKLTRNEFKAKLANGQQQVGLWMSMASNVSTEVIAPSGFDWALIDMEHSPNDLASVLAQLQVLAAYPTSALVRPAWNDPVMVKGLLDLGARGLIFPMIQTPEEAALAVAATRYLPEGIRGVAGSTRATRFGRVENYAKQCEQDICVIVQLETAAAVAQAEEIAAVDGVDAVFFGPADIAADIGKVGQPLSTEVWDIISPAVTKLVKQEVPVGTFVLDADFSIQLFQQGFSFVACGMDTSLLAKASDSLLSKVRNAIEQ